MLEDLGNMATLEYRACQHHSKKFCGRQSALQGQRRNFSRTVAISTNDCVKQRCAGLYRSLGQPCPHAFGYPWQ
jgi:hypothetical protein